MNREFLKELGLEDEQIDAVMKSHGTVVNDTKKELETVKEERNNLATQIEERDTQLEELGEKVKDSEELTTEIERLKTENAETATDYQERMDKQQKNFAIESALREARARDPKITKNALDLDVIHVKEGKITGLDEQLTALKESHEYLFDVEDEGEGKPNFTRPGGSNKPEKMTTEEFNKLSYTERNEIYEKDKSLYDRLTK